MKLGLISSLFLVLPLVLTAPLLKPPKANEYTEGILFYKDGFVLSESNVTRIAFKDVSYTYDETFFEAVYKIRCRRMRVNGSDISFIDNPLELTKDEELQFQEFKNTTEEGGKRMLLYYDKGRIVSKSHGIDRLLIYQYPNRLKVEFAAGTENGMASIENLEGKRFLVERVAGDVDCKQSEVKGLNVTECKGNIQIKNKVENRQKSIG